MTRSMDGENAAVRQAIVELRAADTREMPSFGAVRSRRTRIPARVSVVRVFAIAASIVVVAAGIYGVVDSRRSRLTVPKEVMALSAWRPATDVLLETPTRDLLRHAPRLGASLIAIPTIGALR